MQKDEEIQAFILKNAKELFRRYGLKKTTMEDIAKSSGKGKSTLYYYFKSKDEIFEAVAKQEMESFIKDLKVEVLKVSHVQDRLKLFCSLAIKQLREKVNLYQIVFSELSNQMGLMHDLREKFKHLEIDFLKQILLEGVERQEIVMNTEDVSWFADILSASLRGLELHLVWFEDYPDLEAKLEKMIDMFYHGIKVPKT
ncbi:hypothetical protein BKI52_22680 [marine bacterium AO1-C]|nr:hypothetical protein BKI52_22680 [marine bacterium AO1-C]